MFCTVVPVMGALAIAGVLVAGCWIGQGLWNAMFCLSTTQIGDNMKTILVVTAIWFMVMLSLLAAIPYKFDFGSKRQRRRALEILTHVKCTLWNQRVTTDTCVLWDKGDAEAFNIIQEKLMEVWSEPSNR